MNLLQLSWKNLIDKPWDLLLNLVLFSLGVGLISLLLIFNRQLEDKFQKNLAGIDLVIGAKGSPLQLILSSMYHIDSPTGNVSIPEVRPFLRPGHPLIETAIPLSLGDSYQAYRIVGTEPAILGLYEAQLAEGKVWQEVFEVTLGAGVAADKILKLGDTFFSSHGFVMDEDLEHSDAHPFKVVGILQPTGAVIDQLILTAPQSIWAVHDHAEGMSESDPETETAGDSLSVAEEGHEENDEDHAAHTHGTAGEKPLHEYEDQEITSLLVKFKHRNIQTLNMQRSINENTNLQAAGPVLEMNRLYAMIGDGAEALGLLAVVIVFVSGLSIFISLFSSLKERQYELALLRVMGGSRIQLFFLLILEGLVLAVLGYAVGILLSHIGMEFFAGLMQQSYRYSFTGLVFLKEELYLLAGAVGIGLLAAVIPAIRASGMDISTALSEK